MDSNNIGNNIKKYRKLRGLTQEKLAEMTNLDTKHITRLEKSKHIPNTKTLNKILTALEISYADIGLDFNSEQKIINDNPVYIKCLAILNSAKDNYELEKYYKTLKFVQTLLK